MKKVRLLGRKFKMGRGEFGQKAQDGRIHPAGGGQAAVGAEDD